VQQAAERKLSRLFSIIEEMGSVAVAYSGGVDSTFLLRVAADRLGEAAVAVVGRSPTVPRRELEFALRMAAEIGVPVEVVDTEEMGSEAFTSNPPERCFHCKSELFSRVKAVARRRGLRWVADGSNADDLGDFRPGLRAARELGVRSPLVEAGLGKSEVRLLSRALGLPTWDKPAKACLSSRIPFGSPITLQKLAAVEEAENFLEDLGFNGVRVRHHGEIARVEVDEGRIPRLTRPEIRKQVVSKLKSIGFRFVALDLAGYRSGSLNPEGEGFGRGE